MKKKLFLHDLKLLFRLVNCTAATAVAAAGVDGGIQGELELIGGPHFSFEVEEGPLSVSSFPSVQTSYHGGFKTFVKIFGNRKENREESVQDLPKSR